MRSILIWLVLVCLLPGVIGSSAILYVSYQNERAQLERDTIQTARALMQAVDANLSKAETAARTLSLSEHLVAKDFAAFHTQATDALQWVDIGNNVALSDAAGQQLLNTVRPFPGPLPRHGNPEQLRRVFETGKPVISDVYFGPVLQRPVVSIDVPVLQGGRVVYDLSLVVFPERLQRIPNAQQLPPDWVVSIFDTQGVIASRSHAADRFVGQKGAPALLQRMAQVAEGIVETNTLEGILVSAAFSRSPATQWSVVIGIPTQELTAELQRRFLLLLAIALLLLVVGVVLASILADRIARSIRALIAPAMALGSGEPVTIPHVYLREAEDVGDAIAKASNLLALRSLSANVYDNISDGIVATDPAGTIVSVNPALCSITGYAADELVGANPRILKSNRQGADFYRGIWDAIGKDGCWHGEVWNRRKNGSLFLVRETITSIRDEHGRIEHYIGVMSDITQAKQVEEFMRHRAYHDPLTNLPNRLLFMDRLHQAMAHARRHGAGMALLFVDLDRFKEINDGLGHNVGDELLMAAATRLTGCIRESDTVARLGGDEFTAILNDLKGREEVVRVAQKMLDEMCRLFEIGEQELHLSASIGIAFYPVDGDSAASLLKAADEAMYEAKRNGRNAYSFTALE